MIWFKSQEPEKYQSHVSNPLYLVWGSSVKPNNYLSNIKFDVVLAKKNSRLGFKEVQTIDEKDIEEEVKKKYFDSVVNKTHFLPLEVSGANLILKANEIELLKTGIPEIDNSTFNRNFGLYVKETQFEFVVSKESTNELKIKTTKLKEKSIFREKFNFEEMGIGGLDQEFADIFRIAFASRRYPSSYLAQFNIKHVKGMLFYGPPGTCKTLIARQLGKALHAKEPKVSNLLI